MAQTTLGYEAYFGKFELVSFRSRKFSLVTLAWIMRNCHAKRRQMVPSGVVSPDVIYTSAHKKYCLQIDLSECKKCLLSVVNKRMKYFVNWEWSMCVQVQRDV